MSVNLINSERALIFRIIHKDNLSWLLEHGLHCRNGKYCSNYVTIGSSDLISKRVNQVINVGPSGTLSDYIPFYFTPWSMMLFNIVTGRGVPQQPKDELVILVASLREIASKGIRFVFSDRHPMLVTVQFSTCLDDLERWIPWADLQQRDFKRDPEDPNKTERYQAEALVHSSLPSALLKGVICYNQPITIWARAEIQKRGLNVRSECKPTWFF